MIIKSEQIAPIGDEGVGLPDQLKGTTYVGGEDHDILLGHTLK
jgi:hypothetical protein